MRRPRRRERDAGLVVEVVEVDDAAAPGSSTDPATTSGRPHRRRVRLAVGAALVGVVGVVGVVDQWQARSRAAALRDVPGLLLPLPAAPTEVWRRDDASSVLGVSAGRLVLGTSDGLAGVDATHGTEAWRVDGDGLWCTAVPTAGRAAFDGSSRALESGPPGGDLALCVGVTVPDDLGAGDTSAGSGPGSVVMTVDLRAGEVLHRLDLPGRLVHALPHEGDAVYATEVGGLTLHVVRWDPTSGVVRWRYASREGFVSPSSGVRMESDGGVLTLAAPDSIALDLATGLEVPQPPRRPPETSIEERELTDGTVVRTTYDWTDATSSTEVLAAGGETLYALDEAVLLPGVDADTRNAVLLVQHDEGGVSALDPRTGAEVWALPDLDGESAVVEVGGVLVVLSATGRAVGLDVGDGTVLWEQPVGSSLPTSGLTDGDVVLLGLPGRDAEGPAGTDLVALDVRSGTERWRTALPPRTRHVTSVGGRVVAATDEGLVVLAAPD
ncbi:outer membrane protein assembly factor BamB family protein [Cellulomonas aerilata]|uniref:Pyrrolo-quinoline quinone repeat domain-containing protein n=1 Tax=Cellulomonas aerilata TaxID=515326 RepID=A0A512DDR4_9CELL|nr:PQQ-binding-like beta-propeller repeat protein [Cellulomonas aerilata]GEO34612.1 hypothetical protein CAE01nite_23370 [Cellulomonas aerilata]